MKLFRWIRRLLVPVDRTRRTRTEKLDSLSPQAQQDAIGYSERAGS